MHFDLPIEQLVHRRDTPFQLGFAHQAIGVLPQREEFRALPTYKGLRVLARNEDELATPVDTLREVYGPAVDVQPPRVRLIERELADITGGTARHWIVLSHYALVTRDPGGRAA